MALIRFDSSILICFFAYSCFVKKVTRPILVLFILLIVSFIGPHLLVLPHGTFLGGSGN